MKKHNIILARFYFDIKKMESAVQIKSTISRNWVKIPIIEDNIVGESVLDSTISYLKEKGFTITGYGEAKDHYCILVEEFKSIS